MYNLTKLNVVGEESQLHVGAVQCSANTKPTGTLQRTNWQRNFSSTQHSEILQLLVAVPSTVLASSTIVPIPLALHFFLLLLLMLYHPCQLIQIFNSCAKLTNNQQRRR